MVLCSSRKYCGVLINEVRRRLRVRCRSMPRIGRGHARVSPSDRVVIEGDLLSCNALLDDKAGMDQIV